MLESSSLRLGPWVAAVKAAPGQTDIRDPETGRRLGQARWLIPSVTGWRCWFRLPVLEVVESDDESLLFTLRRSWRPLPGWDVRDADGRFIGSWRHGVALDPLGRRFAVRRHTGNGPATRFLDLQGQEIGLLTPTDDGLQLSFAPLLHEDPFAKMTLLASALVV